MSGVTELLRVAGNFLNEGKPDQAVEVLAAIAPERHDPDTLYLLSIAALECGEPDLSRRAAEACLQLSPKHAGAHFQLGLVALEKGERERAHASFDAARTLAPGWAEAHYNLGVVQAESGQFEEAERSYGLALQAQPDFPHAANNLANLLLERGQAVSALRLLREALAHDPQFATGWCSLGRVLLRQGHSEEAVQSLRKSLSLQPDSPIALENLGDALRQLGRVDEALAAFEAASLSPPQSDSLRFKLASLRGEPIARPPDQLVQSLFDDMADSFDERLVEQLGYRLPFELDRLLGDASGPAFANVLDLGCGTGLSGASLRPRAGRLVGVDLSPRMLDRAAQRGVYDELQQGSLQAALENTSAASWDLIVATDVFVYVGDLGPVFSAIARALAAGGTLCFSVELAQGDGFQLRSSGRYAHPEAYLRELMDRNGLALAHCRQIPLRREHGEFLEGLAVCCRRVS
jgi:predicted TPR repeat methyltransferase